MLSRSAVVLLCIGLSFNANLFAERNFNAVPITLRDAIANTFERNPGLRTFKSLLKAQDGKEQQASVTASPAVHVSVEDAFGTGAFDGVDNAEATLGISWVLEGEARQGYKDVARAESASLLNDFNNKRLDVAAETARLYLICLANQSRLLNSIDTLALASETVLAVKRRVLAGKAPDAELARAQAEVARRELDKEDVEHELMSAIHELAAQWGEISPRFSRVDGELKILPDVLSFEQLKAQIEQSPDFISLASQGRIKQEELRLAEVESDPFWKVNIGVRHNNSSDDQSLLAGLSIPLGGKDRFAGRITQAREQLSHVDARKDELRIRLETTLYVLYQELQHNMHRYDAYRKRIIPQLEKAFNETQKAYELGRYSYFEWREVQSELLDARNALVEDSIATHLKIIEIERLTGVSMTQPH